MPPSAEMAAARDDSAGPALDHLVVVTSDLARAAEDWSRLGFTLSPRGRHSPEMGTVNHTIMFRRDYIELLAIKTATPASAEWRGLLDRDGPGVLGLVPAADSARAVGERWRAAGIEVGPVAAFERPVPLPEGASARACFRIVPAAPETLPGLKVFACEHLTPEHVWLPDLLDHPNTATGLHWVEILAPSVADAIRSWQRLSAVPTGADGHGARLALGRHVLHLRAGNMPRMRVAALGIGVTDPEACAAALAASGRRIERTGATVSVDGPGGIRLVFSPSPGTSA
jgi:hypothetical protein